MGAAGGIGQPLSLLLKQSPLVSKLSLYDIVATPGVAADLSHIETRGQVFSHLGPDGLDASLQGCDVVVIPAGVPRKPGGSKIEKRVSIDQWTMTHEHGAVLTQLCINKLRGRLDLCGLISLW